MTPTIKRYILSSAVTFTGAFLTVLSVDFNQITNPQTLTFGVIVSLILVAVRAGAKAVIEAIVGGHADLPSITASSTVPSNVVYSPTSSPASAIGYTNIPPTV